jgi:hypothetical protein
MRSIATALFLAAAMIALLALMQLTGSPLWISPAMVLVSVAAACVATGGVTWLAVVFGSLGALTLGWLSSWNLPVALIVTSASWLAARAFLTRSQKDLVVFASAAIPGSIVAGWVTGHFSSAPLAQHFAACVFAGAALAVCHVVAKVDTPLAHGLRTVGSAMDGDVGRALREAVDAHRTQAQVSSGKPIPRETWRGLLKDAEARASLRGASGPQAEKKLAELDRRILERVRELKSSIEGESEPVAERTGADTPEEEAKKAETAPTAEAAPV